MGDTILNMVTTPTKNHPTDTIPTRSLTMNMRNLMIITRNHTNKNMNPSHTNKSMNPSHTNPNMNLSHTNKNMKPSHTMIIKNLITRNHTNKNMNTSHTNKSMNRNLIRPLTINIKSLRMNISKTIPINHPKIIMGTTNRNTRNMATTKNHTVDTK